MLAQAHPLEWMTPISVQCDWHEDVGAFMAEARLAGGAALIVSLDARAARAWPRSMLDQQVAFTIHELAGQAADDAGREWPSLARWRRRVVDPVTAQVVDFILGTRSPK